MDNNIQIATFGGGCFWCIDAAFRRVKGVLNVSSGYAGGEIENPSYQQICTGLTGHAEVVQLDFDSSIVSYNTLLEMFFTLHDATQLNRQGNDVGTQYRSVIYYHDEKQKAESQAMIDALQKQIREPIVTELSPLTNFYPAEQYHQDYYNENPNQGYCSILIAPKLAKFEQYYADKLK
ncbi:MULTISPECIES: peptide-methionine (S)-S-oxide reductase MsrA [Pseudoalteromonas]|jgi:peptide-methionine (S)-S-oxide reductase|uniref:Peptide methionine sulfoxide reductase MsrA n=1 Tax=Pseudoalteromonas gelatinilytica TaxID=1703256 RepID=A0ABQ1TCV3_9GAMM|nr:MULTISPECIES: peptide-methionine (S)-S-oxide reductase MsrA [Pseudoalteromonas]MDC3190855.1 peptide-methionine (S)-S-oxide reductase MsrA [Pseudoalteromonas elyakovii]MEC8139966.1 peptide-methionine (S)-S-oxide reductase MsrA [Pseudomonadota bacterium]KPM80020.1 methionine sulfoxide reductase A [Pseudoalteromonas sp. UCD-33C]KPW02199.1 Peptide methionine sulfoxide reductase MsrA [Pseudoalteromonas sp. P1-8]KPZ70769.1 Peptide methionine sulfoxide reductase MsrA [Pseudoalteromonas sp. P1-26]|tara:strand:- start:278 stop:811 length:534 start_codon:yes stop_codon:yes gene_type:complete